MKQEYNFMGILRILYQWRKPIMYVTGGAFVLSLFLSFLLPVYYQGKTVFYAASQDLFKPEKIFGGSNSDMYYYGGGEDIDRILTIGYSGDLIHFLVDSFNLYQHYDINPDKPRSKYNVEKHFLGLYDILQTKRDALELTYEDKNPEMAAIIANAARDHINTIASNLIKESQRKIVESYQLAIRDKEEAINVLLDSLTFYREKHKIYSPKEQTEYLSGRLTELESKLIGTKAKISSLERLSGRTRALSDSLSMLRANQDALQQELLVLNSDTSKSSFNLRNFDQAKGKIEILEESYDRANSQLSADRERLKFFKAALSLDISAVKTIEEASVPVIKHRPKKSIVVLASTAAALLFSIMGVLLIFAYREVDWKEITKPEGV